LQLSIGCVRAKFAKHIAILILVDATASALGFYLFGFAFAYGDDASADGLSPAGNAFIGKNFFAMDNMAPTAYYNWVFQWTVSHVRLLCRPTLCLPKQYRMCSKARKPCLVLVLEPEASHMHAADKTWHSDMMQIVDADCIRALFPAFCYACIMCAPAPTPDINFACAAVRCHCLYHRLRSHRRAYSV